MTNKAWGIVLAGGEGRRLRAFLKSEYGFDHPKQYCAVVGTRTMLRHTIDRIAGLFPQGRQLVLIDQTHLEPAAMSLNGHPPENVVLQPFIRETAPGMLYAILHAFKRDPNAAVGIFPSDHFILGEERFMDCVAKGLSLIPRYPDDIFAVTVKPERPDGGYGWFESAGEIDHMEGVSVHRARGFLEKPDEPTTLRLFSSGGLVNTMVLLGRTITFLRLFERLTPRLAANFAPLLQSIGTPQESGAAADVFNRIDPMNFSSLILEHAFHGVNLINADGVYWSDWGDGGRIQEDIRRFGLPSRARVNMPHHYTVPDIHGRSPIALGS